MMNLYGLIGKKLSHSFSPDYFNNKFDKLGVEAVYELFELQHITELPQLIAHHKNLKGLNVTIPYKKEVIPFLDKIEETAKMLGSVNTIKVDWENNRPVLCGYNTDIVGFERSLVEFVKGCKVDNALILGTGGSAQSIAFVLSKLKIDFHFASRNHTGDNTLKYSDLTGDIISKSRLIINTTPVGMYPQTEESPSIPFELVTPKHFLFDLIYNPLETEFLRKGKHQGASVCNGLKMLEFQAEASWSIWNS